MELPLNRMSELLAADKRLKKAIALFALLSSVSASAVASPEAVNRQFLEYLELAKSGRPIEAAKLFGNLYSRVPEPRILLEYAEANRKGGNLHSARNLFKKFLQLHPDAPNAVIKNVQNRLKEIDRKIVSVRPLFSLGYDQNPYQIPDAQSVILFGELPFDYVPPPDKTSGSSYAFGGVDTIFSLNDALISRLKVSKKEYSRYDLDHVNIQARIEYQHRNDSLFISPSFNISRDIKKDQESGYAISQSWQFVNNPFSPKYFGSEFTYKKFLMNGRSDLDGQSIVVSPFLASKQRQIAFSFEKNQFRNKYEDYSAASLSIHTLLRQVSQSRANLSYRVAKYDESIQLFSDERIDKTISAVLAIPFSAFGLKESVFLNLGYSSRNSNIDFFDITHLNMSINYQL